eukprot:scaffold170877_cov33-Tisochrysis_lutea.AAC.3
MTQLPSRAGRFGAYRVGGNGPSTPPTEALEHETGRRPSSCQGYNLSIGSWLISLRAKACINYAD